MEKKKIILIAVAIISLTISIFIITKLFSKDSKNNYNNPEGSTLVENKEVLKDKQVGDILVSDALLYTMNGSSTYTSTVTNTSKKTSTINLYITFYEGEKKTEVLALYKRKLEPNSKAEIDITFEIDLNKVTKIEYKVK